MNRNLLTKKSMAMTILGELYPNSSMERLIEGVNTPKSNLHKRFGNLMRQRKEHLEDHYNKALDCIDARERKAKEAKCFPCGPLLNQNTATAHEGLYYCGKCQANHMFTTVSPKMPEGFGGVWKGSEAKDGEKIVAEQRAKRTRLEQNEAAREKVAYDKAQKLAGEIKRIAGRMNGYYKIADSNVGSLLSLAEELAEVSEKYREALDNLMAKKPHHK